jgi:hypothetical protein
MKGLILLVAAAAIFTGGCASPDVNPPIAKPRTGYVDFYTDDDSGLCWEIRELEKDQVHGRTLLAEFRARTNEIVRLAFAPGEYRFSVTFLNRAIAQPALAQVKVIEGKITPVQVILNEEGKVLIETRETRMGASYARTGRTTKVRASEGALFRVKAEVQQPMAYQPKERMLSSNSQK